MKYYENRFVAFLDILGFKNMVYDSISDPYKLQKIDMALNYIRNIQLENYKFDNTDMGKQVSVFSDSIVISYKVEPGAGFFVLLDLVHICIDLLSSGILVRGGVTVGGLVHEINKCYGPAMIEAYKLESQMACYPRIIITPAVIENGLFYRINTYEQESEYINDLVQEAENGHYHLDYLSQTSEFDNPRDVMCKVREFIISSLNSCPEDAKPKLIWMRDYYNETIKKLGCHDNFLIQ